MFKKFLLSLLISVCMVFAPAASYAGVSSSNTPQAPKGFVEKAENATFALYASSQQAGVNNAFLCTVTAVTKVKGGYILIGAGHCTSANPDLPSDLTFSVSSQMAQSSADLSPVFLIKADMQEPLDYAIYYFPTDKKISTIPLGDESKARVGDKTIDINFSLGIVKEYSPGIVVSMTIPNAPNYVDGTQGFFEVQEFDSHGASGSSVIDLHGNKVIGLVIAGIDGATIPSFVEPISTVEKAIQGYQLPAVTTKDVIAAQKNILSSQLFQPAEEEQESVSPWQRSHNRPGHSTDRPTRPNPPARQPQRPSRANHPNRSGRGYHHHYRSGDIRVYGGHPCVVYGGVYFFPYGGSAWPEWFFGGDVYFVEVNGQWYVVSYSQPDLMFQVVVY